MGDRRRKRSDGKEEEEKWRKGMTVGKYLSLS